MSYADDTAMIFSERNWTETRERAVLGIKLLRNWLDTYKLTLNIKKTNYIAFSLTQANRPDFSKIKIDEFNEISEVSHTKYLGVVIDRFLKWGPHIDYLSNRIRRLIGKFYELRDFMSRKLLIMVYRALVESLLRYGIVVWGGLYNNALYKLNIVQKFILRVLFRKNRMYASRLLFTKEICNIRTIYMTTICVYLHTHSALKNFVDHDYGTRNKVKRNLKIPLNYRSINLKYVSYLAPRVYNMLPTNIREITDRGRFRDQCVEYICSNYRNFVNVFG